MTKEIHTPLPKYKLKNSSIPEVDITPEQLEAQKKRMMIWRESWNMALAVEHLANLRIRGVAEQVGNWPALIEIMQDNHRIFREVYGNNTVCEENLWRYEERVGESILVGRQLAKDLVGKWGTCLAIEGEELDDVYWRLFVHDVAMTDLYVLLEEGMVYEKYKHLGIEMRVPVKVTGSGADKPMTVHPYLADILFSGDSQESELVCRQAEGIPVRYVYSRLYSKQFADKEMTVEEEILTNLLNGGKVKRGRWSSMKLPPETVAILKRQGWISFDVGGNFHAWYRNNRQEPGKVSIPVFLANPWYKKGTNILSNQGIYSVMALSHEAQHMDDVEYFFNLKGQSSLMEARAFGKMIEVGETIGLSDNEMASYRHLAGNYIRVMHGQVNWECHMDHYLSEFRKKLNDIKDDTERRERIARVYRAIGYH